MPRLAAAELRLRLDRLARAPLALLPTPLEWLPALAKAIGSKAFAVKRDDLTGLAFGGNKVRELEFFVGDAIAKGCDVFVAGGGVAQSNHARQCTAAAVRAGLKPVMVLRASESEPEMTGNLLITHLLGATVHLVRADTTLEDREAMSGAMDAVATRLRAEGYRPYVLYSSVHPLGALGYVECALELAAQLPHDARVSIFVPSMGVTHVGLALGVALLGLPWRVVGITWRPLTAGLPETLASLARQAAELLGLSSPLGATSFETIDHGGPAYGLGNAESWAALFLAARNALLLDPVYTAKGMAGLLAASGRGELKDDDVTVFLHTGGLPALFAQRDAVLSEMHAHEVAASS